MDPIEYQLSLKDKRVAAVVWGTLSLLKSYKANSTKKALVDLLVYAKSIETKY